MQTQLPFPDHHAGKFNTRKKHGPHNKVPPGCFNVNSENDWIIGGNIPDERLHQPSSNYAAVMHLDKPRSTRKYF